MYLKSNQYYVTSRKVDSEWHTDVFCADVHIWSGKTDNIYLAVEDYCSFVSLIKRNPDVAYIKIIRSALAFGDNPVEFQCADDVLQQIHTIANKMSEYPPI